MTSNNLQITLDRRGIRQVELAHHAGLSVSTIGGVARNKRTPSETTKHRIIVALGELSNTVFSLDEIFPDPSEPLSIFFDLDSINPKSATEVIDALSELFGARLSIANYHNLPPQSDSSSKKARRKRAA
ncbi:MAG: helix-turn-helix transcriptional regulator [Candidatus Sedimenticola sp. (ex Thyasira tokunagai)]